MKDGVRVDINAGETVTVICQGGTVYQFVGSTGYNFTCEIK